MGLKAALGKEGREEEALAKKGKDTTVSKLGQLKDTAASAVQKAVEYLSGKKEETKQKVVETAGKTKYMTYETAEKTKEKLSETEEKVRRKMEELSKDEDANRAREASEQVTTGMRTIPIVERVKVDVVGTDQDPLLTLSEGKTPIYSTPTTAFLQIVLRSVMGMMGANHWWVGLDMNPVDFEKNNELLR
ncbi:hypothetical protein ACFX2I_014546 [Malus domestica]